MPNKDYKIILFDTDENRYFIVNGDEDDAFSAIIMEFYEKPGEESKDIPVKLVLNKDGYKMDIEYVEDASCREEEYRLCKSKTL